MTAIVIVPAGATPGGGEFEVHGLPLVQQGEQIPGLTIQVSDRKILCDTSIRQDRLSRLKNGHQA